MGANGRDRHGGAELGNTRRWGPAVKGEPVNPVAVLGPGRIGRQIGLAFALGGRRVLLVDVKARAPAERQAVFTDARREIARDLKLMAEEGGSGDGDIAPA